MTLVYLETSFLMSAMVTEDENHHKTLPVLEKIRSGAYVGIVSRHAFNEILDALRRKTPADPNVKSTADPRVLHRLVEERYKEITGRIFASRNVRIQDIPVPIVAVLLETMKLLLPARGTIKELRHCPICHSRYYYLDYDGPDHDDVLHLIIADKVGCDQLITFDRDYNVLTGIPAYSHLAIKVL